MCQVSRLASPSLLQLAVVTPMARRYIVVLFPCRTTNQISLVLWKAALYQTLTVRSYSELSYIAKPVWKDPTWKGNYVWKVVFPFLPWTFLFLLHLLLLLWLVFESVLFDSCTSFAISRFFSLQIRKWHTINVQINVQSIYQDAQWVKRGMGRLLRLFRSWVGIYYWLYEWTLVGAINIQHADLSHVLCSCLNSRVSQQPMMIHLCFNFIKTMSLPHESLCIISIYLYCKSCLMTESGMYKPSDWLISFWVAVW